MSISVAFSPRDSGFESPFNFFSFSPSPQENGRWRRNSHASGSLKAPHPLAFRNMDSESPYSEAGLELQKIFMKRGNPDHFESGFHFKEIDRPAARAPNPVSSDLGDMEFLFELADWQQLENRSITPFV